MKYKTPHSAAIFFFGLFLLGGWAMAPLAPPGSATAVATLYLHSVITEVHTSVMVVENSSNCDSRTGVSK